MEDMEQASDDIEQPSPAAVADATVSAAPIDEQQQQQQEVASIEQQLADNPAQYEVHARLLRLLRSLHETDALRAARQRMADLFPLTADLWQEWLEDEQQRIDSHDDQVQLLALHQRACADYLVPQLWLQYVQYAEQLHYSADEQQWGDEADDRPDSGVNRVRAVYREAVRAMGAHRLDGEKLWRSYRKFEVRVLTAMLQLKAQREDERDSMEEEKAEDDEDDAKEEEEDTEEERQDVALVMKQVERIVAIYRRCLALPLNGLEQAYNEYRQFLQQQGAQVEDDTTATFKQAKTQRETRTPYEKALPHNDPAASTPPTGILSADELSAWYSYIQFEHQQSAKRRPTRVAVLYERALTSSFLHADMWSAYTMFLEERLSRQEKREEEKRAEGEEEDDKGDEIGELHLAYQRAVRNVPHSAALWNGLIRTLERRGSSQDAVLAAFQRASEALASRGGDDLASVCLSVSDCLRRQLRSQLLRDNRSRSRSPMHSPTTSSSSNTTTSVSNSATLSVPFSRPPSKRTVLTTALDTLRPIFQQAIQALRYHNPALSHPTQHSELTASVFLAYHSIESHDARDTTAARAVMEQWAEIAGGEWRVWTEWARLEAEAGELTHARQVYKRGLERLQLDWAAESVCWEWLRFEREHGSVEDYCVAWRRCEKLFGQFNAARTALQAQQQTDATTAADGATAQLHVATGVHTDGASSADPHIQQTPTGEPQDSERKEKRNKKRNQRDSTADSEHNKQAESDSTEQAGRNKRRKAAEIDKKQRKKKGDRAMAEQTAVEEGKMSAEEEMKAEPPAAAQSNQQQQQADSVKAATQPAAPNASAAVESVQPTAATTEPTDQPAPAAKPEHAVEHPTRTLLVSNLSWVTTRDTLHSLFQPHGGVESVTLHPDAATHKQYAYIVYASKDAIKAAVAATHSHAVDGSTVEVECVAHRHKREKQQHKIAAHRNLTVFIKQLTLHDDVEARLRHHFDGCGTIARVRVSRDSRTGEMRSVAWVEWADKEAFERALRLDDSVMEGDEQPIRVVPDRPPPPRQGGGKKESEEPSSVAERQRSRLQLMPRTVQAFERDKRSDSAVTTEDAASRAGTDAMETSDTSKEAATQAAPMSNNDFRAMLMRRN